MKVKIFTICLAVIAMGVLPVSVMAAEEEGAHNHTDHGCSSCHIMHNAQQLTGVPLWNGRQTTTTFTLYNATTTGSTSTTAATEQPRGASKLCLSCHDGISYADPNSGVASHYAPIGSGGFFMTHVFGNDLSKMHPISFNYNTVATADDEIRPSTSPVDGGGTIATEMLDSDGYLECSACHDVHYNATLVDDDANALTPDVELGTLIGDLRVTTDHGDLCKTCHIK